MKTSVDTIINSVNTSALMERSLSDWKKVLATECQVYVFGENYLAKRFDQIHYKFCELIEAKQVLTDNLYAILRFKYFPKVDDEVEEKVQEIVKFFCVNLKTSLIKVSFDTDTDANQIRLLDDGQIAFRNGVFDFRKNDWLFKYNIIRIPELSNNIYTYPNTHIIQWYFDFNFEPLPIDINEMSLQEFMDFMKEYNKEDENECFELICNMAHDQEHMFSRRKFDHFTQVLAYSLLQSFSQYFVMLVGSGGNGKNSLFDGCFTSRVIPRPTSNSLESFEKDRFITGALENKSHNIYLETSQQISTFDSQNFKNITGSMYQTIECKGVQKYQSVINCKYIFAANDQEKLKFSDTTPGFRRRINVYEIFFKWDSEKEFLKKGDYYDTTFSDDYREIKNDINNTIVYIYFGMYGMLSATKNFTENFKFRFNDWKLEYSNIDFDLKNMIENVTPELIVSFAKMNNRNYSNCRMLLYDSNKIELYKSPTIKNYGVYNFEDLIKMFENDEETFLSYFSEYDCFIDIKLLQQICGNNETHSKFISSLKKVYSISDFVKINSKNYLKITFVNNKMKVLS